MDNNNHVEAQERGTVSIQMGSIKMEEAELYLIIDNLFLSVRALEEKRDQNCTTSHKAGLYSNSGAF